MKASILVVDGHASRWCYAGIMWLLANKGWPMCEPSKASRWAQVGDNGVNAMIVAGMSHFYSVVRVSVYTFDYKLIEIIHTNKPPLIFTTCCIILQWCNKYDGLRHFNRDDYNWCYVQTINRINERMSLRSK